MLWLVWRKYWWVFKKYYNLGKAKIKNKKLGAGVWGLQVKGRAGMKEEWKRLQNAHCIKHMKLVNIIYRWSRRCDCYLSGRVCQFWLEVKGALWRNVRNTQWPNEIGFIECSTELKSFKLEDEEATLRHSFF